MSNAIPLTKELITELNAYLKKNVTSLQQVLTEWPDANVQLNLPSITIFTGAPKFTPFQPTIYKQTPIPGSDTHSIIETMVGEWDYNMQLDLWARNIEERGVVFNDFFIGFNKAIPDGPMGLSLQLVNYYNVWARYDLDQVTFLDDEASIQRGERRAKIMLLVNVPAILSQTVPIMKTIETTFDIPNTIPNS